MSDAKSGRALIGFMSTRCFIVSLSFLLIACSHSRLEHVNARGDQAMGFSHATTTHHFHLLRDGGAIEITTNDPNDTTGRDQIRRHLAMVAQMFSAGDFNLPMIIHAQMPPGVETMKRLRDKIRYTFEDTKRGGEVRIATDNKDALTAVHEFLRFQIKDHKTGDSTQIQPVG
jgi:hypothetical protein